MKLLRRFLDFQSSFFQKGKPLERFHAVHEAVDDFLYTPGKPTDRASHIRDALDLKRLMGTVIVALAPCILMAFYNTGLQANLAIQEAGVDPEGWRAAILTLLGVGFSPQNVISCFLHGGLYFVPVALVTFTVGGIWEMIFAVVRGHEISEGFLVTGTLFPLICPPTIPLWQVALGISFGVVLGKEVFGGVGRNIMNPALTGRAFLFLAYPQNISGDMVWVGGVDGYSGATLLAQAAEHGKAALTVDSGTFIDALFGTIPGSMGETSALACLFGAIVLILTRVGSWRIIMGVTVGTIFTSILLNLFAGHVDNPMFDVPFWWHMVMGSWAFGAVFMATDPVSGPFSGTGKWIYGLLIGLLVVLVRVVNPAFPEGVMLAILLMNVFASTIDYFVVRRHIRRRRARHAAA